MTLQVANYLIDRLSKGTVTAELVQPDELISGMISQVAAEPEMGTLLSQFIYSTAGEPHSALTGVVSPGAMLSWLIWARQERAASSCWQSRALRFCIPNSFVLQ